MDTLSDFSGLLFFSFALGFGFGLVTKALKQFTDHI